MPVTDRIHTTSPAWLHSWRASSSNTQVQGGFDYIPPQGETLSPSSKEVDLELRLGLGPSTLPNESSTATGPLFVFTTTSSSSSSMGQRKGKAVLQGSPPWPSTTPTSHSHHALRVLGGEEAAVGKAERQAIEISVSSLPPQDKEEYPVNTTITATNTIDTTISSSSNTAHRKRKRTPSQLKRHREAERERYHRMTLEERRAKYADKHQRRTIIRSKQRKEERQKLKGQWRNASNECETGNCEANLKINPSRGD